MTNATIRGLIEELDAMKDTLPRPGRRDLLERTIAALSTLSEGTGASLIAAERATHSARGYDASHDAEHAHELMLAAEAYTRHAGGSRSFTPVGNERSPSFWPWAERFWRPRGRVRTLVKAGALIAAAIDALLAEGK